MIGCIPIKPKIQTIKGSRIIIAQKGKLFPILFDIKVWISTEPLKIDPKNIETDISNISSPDFKIKLFKLLMIDLVVSGLLNIWTTTKIGITITIAFKAVLSKIWPTANTDKDKINSLGKIGFTQETASNR